MSQAALTQPCRAVMHYAMLCVTMCVPCCRGVLCGVTPHRVVACVVCCGMLLVVCCGQVLVLGVVAAGCLVVVGVVVRSLYGDGWCGWLCDGWYVCGLCVFMCSCCVWYTDTTHNTHTTHMPPTYTDINAHTYTCTHVHAHTYICAHMHTHLFAWVIV